MLVLSSEGQLLREYSLYDLLSSNPDLYRLPRSTDHEGATLKDGSVDLLHANSCARMPHPSLQGRSELYGESCVLVCMRHQNLVAIVDLQRERLLWVWGPGRVQYPHEATWLENGNVLVFDNGTKSRGYSRIVEVDPATGEVVWEYRARPPKDFFSAGRGTAQALSGGNVLVASSAQGRIFEVRRGGGVVWRYVHRGEDGRRRVIRAERYPPALVEPLLARPDPR